MMTLTKEKYCEIIDRVINDANVADQIDDVLRKNKIYLDFFSPYCLFDRNVTDLLDLLEILTNDVDGWTSYWCFECYGNVDNFEAYDENEHQFYIHNSSELYDFIVYNTMNYVR